MKQKKKPLISHYKNKEKLHLNVSNLHPDEVIVHFTDGEAATKARQHCSFYCLQQNWKYSTWCRHPCRISNKEAARSAASIGDFYVTSTEQMLLCQLKHNRPTTETHGNKKTKHFVSRMDEVKERAFSLTEGVQLWFKVFKYPIKGNVLIIF